MRSTGRDRLRVQGPGTPDSGAPHLGPVPARIAAIALITAAMVFLGGGGDAFWLCLPAVLLASATSQSRSGAALGTATVLAAAVAPSVAWMRLHPLPSPLLVLIVPFTSAAVMVVVRERLGRQRDAMRDYALTDPVTGIANRRSLLWRAEHEIARHRRSEREFAVVMLKLDGLGLIDDRFGRELLRGIADGLERSMRAQDTVARIGRDQFSVLAPETDAVGTDGLAARVADALSHAIGGVETVRVRMGVAVFPEDGESAASLLHAAGDRLLGPGHAGQPTVAGQRAA